MLFFGEGGLGGRGVGYVILPFLQFRIYERLLLIISLLGTFLKILIFAMVKSSTP